MSATSESLEFDAGLPLSEAGPAPIEADLFDALEEKADA